MESKIQDIQKLMLNWFEDNKRDFPWRKKSISKYQIIISEILLQRTKAETIAKFYPNFIEKYPSWESLCKTSQLELQQFLKPIGLYKQRGTRLLALAKEMEKRKGRMPKNRKEIEEIPMMGQYISNAYELFILNKPSPLLDVNMARVLERLFGNKKLKDLRYDPELQNLAHEIVNHSDSKKLNWAILDFGSLICKSRNPVCDKCPIQKYCLFNIESTLNSN